ncbi:putative methyltransferase YcgJ [Candidatus Izimaplasma bacterium HR1]|uniref:class I SAM-dependent methyltransferase n=1 Tax=Candidatus Izimoplasma sp. HR1 TaxID=1541959 RepID=UPI0004F92498|nr:putative methyltransferase YcgJ [Candidatus Izimaplasma bacterium HR1]
MEKLAKLLHQKQASRILDVGTGTGNFVKLITSCYNDYQSIIGIDTIDGAIKLAKEAFDDERITFRNIDGYHMDYPDKYFDIVCLSNSLHHLDAISPLFKEMERVLKDDGFIIVAEMINNDLTNKQLSHLKIHHFAAKTDRLKGDIHHETYSEKTIQEILKKETTLASNKSWILKILASADDDLPDRFKWPQDTVSRLIKRIPLEFQTEELKREGQTVVEYINEHGFDTCPTLIVVMRK